MQVYNLQVLEWTVGIAGLIAVALFPSTFVLILLVVIAIQTALYARKSINERFRQK